MEANEGRIGHTQQEAVNKISQMMNPQPAAEPEEPAVEVEEAEESPVPEEPAEDDTTDVAPEEDDAEPAEDDADEGEEPELHTVKIDGVEKQVTYDELIKGYQTDAYNTQRSQKLAEERRSIEAERTQGIQQLQERAQRVEGYFRAQAGTLQELRQRAPQPDPRLRQTNPQQFQEQLTAHYEMEQFVQEQLGSIEKHYRNWAQEKQQAVEQLAEEARAAEAEKLFSAKPDWNEQDTTKAIEVAESYGLTVTNDVLKNTSAALFLAFRDLAELKDLRGKVAEYEKKISGAKNLAPKAVKAAAKKAKNRRAPTSGGRQSRRAEVQSVQKASTGQGRRAAQTTAVDIIAKRLRGGR